MDTLKKALVVFQTLLKEYLGLENSVKIFGSTVVNELDSTTTLVSHIEDDAHCLELVSDVGIIEFASGKCIEKGEIVMANLVDKLTKGAYAVHSE